MNQSLKLSTISLHEAKGFSFLLLCFRASQLLQENMTSHSCVSYKTILSLKSTSDFHKLNKQHFI